MAFYIKETSVLLMFSPSNTHSIDWAVVSFNSSECVKLGNTIWVSVSREKIEGEKRVWGREGEV